MMGGYDFKKSQYNRALQARRNPGSAFKPIIYAAALDKGLTPATLIDDSPVEYPGGIGKTWAPRNYDGIYRGPVTMREALTNSINMVSIKILDTIGVQYAIEYAKKLGITSPLSDNLTLALGASSVTPLELTNAYATFASGGYRLTPFALIKVTDRRGQVLEEIAQPSIPVFALHTSVAVNLQPAGPPTAFPPDVQNQAPGLPAAPGTETAAPAPTTIVSALLPVPVISPETAFVITSLMQSVVQSGTGRRALAVGRPVAAKTGTTNDMKDAWFVGFIPQLVAGVWVGFDQEKSLGAGGSGGQAAAPIWTEFMQKAVAGMPVEPFKAPANISSVTINPATGRLVPEGSPGSVREYFNSGTEPKGYDSDSR
jgi:penicillin-binding protein 1A